MTDEHLIKNSSKMIILDKLLAYVKTVGSHILMIYSVG
jgi:hypothetical protein